MFRNIIMDGNENIPTDFFKGIKISLKNVLKHHDINLPKIRNARDKKLLTEEDIRELENEIGELTGEEIETELEKKEEECEIVSKKIGSIWEGIDSGDIIMRRRRQVY